MLEHKSIFRWPAGLLLVLAALLAVCGASAGPAYPLKLSPGNHYVVDHAGNPFFIQGDSPWFLTESLNSSDVNYYLSNRWVQGYNSIILDLAAQMSDDSQNFQGNIYGQLPFTSVSGAYTNLLSWNVNYFTNVDAVIQRAGFYGICVFAYPLYDGFNGASWYPQMTGNSSNALWQYGNFIGNRYKNFTNLVWVGAGDYSEPNAPGSCLWNIVAAGILAADTNHLITGQAGRPTPATYYSAFVTLNCTYGSQFPYVESLANYQRSPVLASFAREPYYENRNLTGSPYTAFNCRNFAYWAVFSGDMGHFYGDESQWPFKTGWQAEMWDAGATTITNLVKLINTRPWWNCVPDSNHITITSGYGTYGAGNYVVCTREATGKTIMAYIPQGTLAPTMDMTKVSGATANTWWYNPRTGAATAIGTYNNTGTRTFTPPDSNDWVLVADDSSQLFPAPGTATNTPPTITAISNQATGTNTSTDPIPFTIGDATTPATNLILQAISSAPTIIPTNNIIFGGSGSNRTVTLTPMPGKSGSANITISVSDGTRTNSTTFQLSVQLPPLPPTNLRILPGGSGMIAPRLNSRTWALGKRNPFNGMPVPQAEFAGWTGKFVASNSRFFVNEKARSAVRIL